MQTIIHKADERGVAEHGWLHGRFSFSFADWYNPEKMGFGVLRVLNDDIIDPHSGFGMHSHSNMEIITIVMEGTVSHDDSMGNKYEVPALDVQVMSAGTGVVHSELNKGDERLALFQVWIEPSSRGVAPRYDQTTFGDIKEKNKFELLVLGKDGGAPLYINQDVYVYRALLDIDTPVTYTIKNPQNGVYLFVVNGSIRVAETELGPRDAIGVWEAKDFTITAISKAQVLLFEVPMK